MNFEQAQDALAKGQKVKLSDWSGYWFSNNGQIMVFTKDGDILDTPHIDRYKDRDDWEETDGKMGFDFALRALNNGKKLQREGWNGKGQFVYRTVGNTVSKDFIPKFASLPASVKEFLLKKDEDIIFNSSLTLYNAQGQMQPGWVPSQGDLSATDWQIVN